MAAGNTKFGLSPSGELVYRSNGNLAPADYFTKTDVQGRQTVYRRVTDKKTGDISERKVGTVAKSTLRKSEVKRIERAESRRVERKRYALERKDKSKVIPGRSALQRIASARQEAMRQMKRPQLIQKRLTTQNNAEGFKHSVMKMSELIKDTEEGRAIADKISRMDADKLLQMYEENDIIFEVYFDYGDISVTRDSKGREKGIQAGKQTRTNAEFLVNAYESKFGAIL